MILNESNVAFSALVKVRGGEENSTDYQGTQEPGSTVISNRRYNKDNPSSLPLAFGLMLLTIGATQWSKLFPINFSLATIKLPSCATKC